MKKALSFSITAFMVLNLAGCGVNGLNSPLKATTTTSLSLKNSTKSFPLMPLSTLTKIQKMSYTSALRAEKALPAQVDIRMQCTPIAHQGITNACAAFASVDGLAEFLAKRQGKQMDYAPRFIWNLSRQTSGELTQNVGVDYRDAMRMITKVGLIPETKFPFPSAAQQNNPTDFSRLIAELPSPTLIAEAASNRIFSEVQVLNSADEMKASVAAGMPVVFGIAVFPSIEDAKNGVIPMPSQNEQAVGGHIMLCVGYDDNKQQFIVRNSWGQNWGDHGYGYLPYTYIRADLAHVGMTAKL